MGLKLPRLAFCAGREVPFSRTPRGFEALRAHAPIPLRFAFSRTPRGFEADTRSRTRSSTVLSAEPLVGLKRFALVEVLPLGILSAEPLVGLKLFLNLKS